MPVSECQSHNRFAATYKSSLAKLLDSGPNIRRNYGKSMAIQKLDVGLDDPCLLALIGIKGRRRNKEQTRGQLDVPL